MRFLLFILPFTLLFVFSLILFHGYFRSAEAVSSTALGLNEEGFKLYNEGKFLEAESRFRKALEEDASFAEARFNLALSLYAKGDYAGAASALFKLQEIRPDFPKLMEVLKQTLRKLLQTDAEIEEGPDPFRLMRLAGKVFRDDLPFRREISEKLARRAEAYETAGYRKLAGRAASLAIEIYGDMEPAFFVLADSGEPYEPAYFEKYLVRKPDSAAALYAVARARLLKGPVEDAVEYLKKAGALEPGNPRYKKLEAEIELARRKGIPSGGGREETDEFELSGVDEETGEIEVDRLRELEEEVASGNAPEKVFSELADHYLRNRKFSEAERVARSGQKVYPGSAALRLIEALAVARQGKTVLASGLMKNIDTALFRTPADFSRAAAIYARIGDKNRAFSIIERGIQRFGECASLYFTGGILLYQKREKEAALDYLRRACQIEPTNPRYHYFLALACRQYRLWPEFDREKDLVFMYDRKGIYRAYLEQIAGEIPSDKLISLYDENASLEVIEAYLRAGELERARKRLIEFIRRHPRDVRGLEKLAYLEEKAGNDISAITLLIQAIDVGGPSSSRLVRLGRLFLRIGLSDEALSSYEEAILYEPEDAIANYEVGLLRLALGDREGAQSALIKARDMSVDPEIKKTAREVLKRGVSPLVIYVPPSKSEVYVEVADALMEKNLMDRAFDFYTRAKDLGGLNGRARLGRFMVFRQKKNYRAAVAELEEVAPDDPYYLEAKKILGKYYIENKKYSLARSLFEKLDAKETSSFDVKLGLAQSLYHLGKYEEALIYLEEASRLAIRPEECQEIERWKRLAKSKISR